MSARTRLTRWFTMAQTALKLRDAVTGDTYSADELATDANSPVKQAIDAASGEIGTTAPVNAASATATLTFEAGLTSSAAEYTVQVGTYPVIYSVGTTASASQLAAALASFFDARDVGNGVAVDATVDGATVTFVATPGAAGNSVAISTDVPSAVLSGGTMTGGLDATATPPFLRVADGKLFIQEAGVWKQVALSTLS